MRVVQWAISRLKPYANNARTHSPAQVEQLCESFKKFGWTNPIRVLEDGTILAGHGRVLAAQRLGIETCPVIVTKGWSDEQVRAYVLADNKLALNAGWDADLLAIELTALHSIGELKASGFNLREFESLTLPPGADQKGGNDIPEAFEVLVTCSGELSQSELLTRLSEEGYKCRSLIR